MERDASSSVDVLPPVPWETTRKVAFLGAGLCAAATAIGLIAGLIDDPPSILSTARLFLVFLGGVAAGLAVSFRPDLLHVWLIGAATALLGVTGSPAHWDSFRLVFAVLAALALLRAGLLIAPPRLRLALISTFILLHFFGILLATTSPSPTPWMVDQLYNRAYEPYLRFVYLRNAYHFYSPEPGPTSLVAVLVKTEDGKETGADGIVRTKYRTDWLVLPRRSAAGPDKPSDVKDPLGVAYYRRLSLTDAISHVGEGMTYETFEKSELLNRRKLFALPGNVPYIPLHPNYLGLQQYRQPAPRVSRYFLPSYAQHILMDLPEEDRGRTTLKIYRIEHRTLDVGSYIGLSNYYQRPGDRPGDPYHPTTYQPYFLGEYGFVKNPEDGSVHVQLLDPKEPMLYWLLPVVERPGGTPSDAGKKDFIDYFSVHAGTEFEWSQLR